MQKTIKPIVMLSVIALLAGCGVLSPVEAPQIHQYQIITAVSDPASCQGAGKSSVLQISPVQVFAPYDSKNMYYSESQYEINSYALSQWSANPGFMLTQAIQQKLQQSCAYSNVVSADVMSTAKYRLVSQLIDFKQVINGSSATMNLTVLAQLIDNSNNLVVKSKTFTETAPVTANPDGYIKGANDATAAFLNDLTTWLSN